MTTRPADDPIDLLVLSSFPPALGGGELQTLLQLREVARRGHRVTVIDIRPHADRGGEESIDGIRVVRLRAPRLPVLRSIVFHARLLASVLRHGRGADVAHVNHIGSALTTGGTALGVLSVPRLLCVWGSSAPGVGPFAPGAGRALAVAVARRFECTVALASASARFLGEHGFDPARLRAIPNGVDVARFHPRADAVAPPAGGWPDGGPHVLAVGRLVPAKGLDLLLAAWCGLAAAHPRSRLVLAGDGPLRNELEAMARRLGVGASVVFLGVRTDVPDLLRRADVYVSASRTEGMSNALLEALASGCAAAATRVGAAEDLIADRENGLLVAPESESDLRRALGELLGDADLRGRLGGSARRRVEESYSIGAVVDRYLEAYRELIDRPTRRDRAPDRAPAPSGR